MSQLSHLIKVFVKHTEAIKGQDITAILAEFHKACSVKGQPTMILARTEKGKGVSFTEGKDNWHGKAMKKDELEKAIAELEKQIVPGVSAKGPELIRKPAARERPAVVPKPIPPPSYKLGDQVATREAFGD